MLISIQGSKLMLSQCIGNFDGEKMKFIGDKNEIMALSFINDHTIAFNNFILLMGRKIFKIKKGNVQTHSYNFDSKQKNKFFTKKTLGLLFLCKLYINFIATMIFQYSIQQKKWN